MSNNAGSSRGAGAPPLDLRPGPFWGPCAVTYPLLDGGALVCDRPGLWRCPDCGVAFCARHFWQERWCLDCADRHLSAGRQGRRKGVA